MQLRNKGVIAFTAAIVLSGLSFALALWLSLSILEAMVALLSPRGMDLWQAGVGWWQAGAVLWSMGVITFVAYGSGIDRLIVESARLIAEVKKEEAEGKEDENDLQH
ncbi:hypothetical protein ACIRTW_00290 (plasmid) [Pseudomonas aeruginosa]|uniref:hypothetical protein n=1 Tax=Pseudomonas aeruginosa TaxID=287 RepID=UPI00053ED12B|nr:hypothetical protein [Pseudomonas aeruginosa]EKV9032411.1 hypothetical protein [Pseudomonas aeruginosa]KSS52671.1 hypothetical protein APB59_14505 [Pseudomonas aeruginosa]MBN0429424.1 hypothetical protein [Pseudomonas aeruginosa]MBN0762739.1 hypothetical protein [Pseudomonas aeruginosa]MBW6375686.1 hypothetical protein [Pseudomonas aeruginosa]